MTAPGGNPYKTNVKGLAEFRKQLKQLADESESGEIRAELKKAHYEIAEKVAATARFNAMGVGGVAAHSIDALMATKTEGKAAIRIDGAKYPWALGAEFGSKRFKQFKAFRGNAYPQTWTDSGGAGYFLYPTIRDMRDEVIDEYMDRIEKIARRAFPD